MRKLRGSKTSFGRPVATHAALVAVAVAAGIVLVLVLPAMFLLFTVFDRPELEVIE